MPVYQFVAITKGRSPFMRQCDHRRVKIGEDCINRAVGRDGPALRLGNRADARMNGWLNIETNVSAISARMPTTVSSKAFKRPKPNTRVTKCKVARPI